MTEETAVLVPETLPSSPSENITMSDWTPEQRDTWRTTGELPKKETPKEVPSEATKVDETAAASEAAKPQEKRHTAEDRKAQLQKEIRELANQKRQLEESLRPKADVKPEPSPAKVGTKKPSLEDKNADGTPKFKTWEELETANDEWVKQEAIREFRAISEKEAREAAKKAADQKLSEDWTKRLADAKKEHSDFDEVVTADKPIFTKVARDSALDRFVQSSEAGPKLLYHLTKNPSELERILPLDPIQTIRELTKIELLLAKPEKKETPVQPVSKAPKPPSEVGGHGTAAEDALVAEAKANPGKLTRNYKAEADRQYAARMR
jgi:hypothetical protein